MGFPMTGYGSAGFVKADPTGSAPGSVHHILVVVDQFTDVIEGNEVGSPSLIIEDHQLPGRMQVRPDRARDVVVLSVPAQGESPVAVNRF